MKFPVKYPLSPEDTKRFLDRVQVNSLEDCWPFQGGGHDVGGHFWIGGETRYAYIIAYEIAIGPVPAGDHVLHHCRDNVCCNPKHLYLGNSKETTFGNLRERFYAKVNIPADANAGCWNWLGALDNERKYGKMWFQGKLRPATHISLYLHNGVWVPKGFHACHRCEKNPRCVRPDHLYIGTPQDNKQDAVEQGHVAKGETHGSVTCPESVRKGELNGRAKLTEREVVLIRRTCEAYPRLRGLYAFLGRLLGIGADVVSDIAGRKLWQSVPQDHLPDISALPRLEVEAGCAPKTGEDSPHAKYTARIAAEIRYLYQQCHGKHGALSALAARYGISISHVSRIVHGEAFPNAEISPEEAAKLTPLFQFP